MIRTLLAAMLALLPLAALAPAVQAQQGPLRIEITEGVIEPLPIAVPPFIADGSAGQEFARTITDVVRSDLEGTGLFRIIPEEAYISQLTSFEAPPAFRDWKAINAQGLVAGAVSVEQGSVVVRFRVYDVFSEAELGKGLQLVAPADTVRRLGHKVADQVYSRITGEGGYFDSRVVFVSEQGPKNARQKRLAIMDYDGANVQFLTDSQAIVLAPRFSPRGDRILYTSYETGFPEVYVMDVGTVTKRSLSDGSGTMSFAPRFAPDGRTVAYSLSDIGGNTDLYTMDLETGARRRLTESPSIETAPSFSPDGGQIVFESDRSGTPQLYVMPAGGGEARRISFGQGRYGTPVWSPRGDLIAFTKQNAGRFHIGVMRTDGSEERLLTSSFLDEGPTWAPNGRVVMFTRETQGSSGAPAIYSVDVTGRNLKRVTTPAFASDPSWSPLLQ